MENSNQSKNPVDLWESEVIPQIQKLSALSALVEHGGEELFNSGRMKAERTRISCGIMHVLDEAISVLLDFEETLSDSHETTGGLSFPVPEALLGIIEGIKTEETKGMKQEACHGCKGPTENQG